MTAGLVLVLLSALQGCTGTGAASRDMLELMGYAEVRPHYSAVSAVSSASAASDKRRVRAALRGQSPFSFKSRFVLMAAVSLLQEPTRIHSDCGCPAGHGFTPPAHACNFPHCTFV